LEGPSASLLITGFCCLSFLVRKKTNLSVFSFWVVSQQSFHPFTLRLSTKSPSLSLDVKKVRKLIKLTFSKFFDKSETPADRSVPIFDQTNADLLTVGEIRK